MENTDGAIDHELRQLRLSRFGRVLALVTLGYVALTASASIWLGQFWFNRSSVPLLAASGAFASLWFLLRGAPRSRRFVRAVELSTLFVGAAAISTTALVMDLLAQPDMIVRDLLSFMLLVYAVCVGARTARESSRVRLGGSLDQRASCGVVDIQPPQAAFGRGGRKRETRLG